MIRHQPHHHLRMPFVWIQARPTWPIRPKCSQSTSFASSATGLWRTCCMVSPVASLHLPTATGLLFVQLRRSWVTDVSGFAPPLPSGWAEAIRGVGWGLSYYRMSLFIVASLFPNLPRRHRPPYRMCLLSYALSLHLQLTAYLPRACKSECIPMSLRADGCVGTSCVAGRSRSLALSQRRTEARWIT